MKRQLIISLLLFFNIAKLFPAKGHEAFRSKKDHILWIKANNGDAQDLEKMLKTSGCPVNVCHSSGTHILEVAHPSCVELLIKAGSKIKAKNKEGFSVLGERIKSLFYHGGFSEEKREALNSFVENKDGYTLDDLQKEEDRFPFECSLYDESRKIFQELKASRLKWEQSKDN
jgi:hypothetical protein